MSSEECEISAAHSLDALNLLSGLFFVVIFLTVSLIVHFMIRYGLGGVRNKLASLLRYVIILLFIVSIIMGIGDAAYSVYIANQVYGKHHEEFLQGQINCSNFVYYSSFVSVVIAFNYIFVEIGLTIFLCILLY
jgi:hypothetical protein